jgi:Trk K+ transport system NAD-binding subunit
VLAAPVIDAERRYVGVVSLDKLPSDATDSQSTTVGTATDSTFAPVHDTEHLNVVLDILTAPAQSWAAVVDGERRIVGVISISDIVRSYRQNVLASLRRAAELGGMSGVSEVTVEVDSALVGKSLRDSVFSRSVLITSIERGRQVITPTGDSVIHSGDRLMVLGTPTELDHLMHIAAAGPPSET